MDYTLSGKDAMSALHVLAYLFLRMGFWDKAERAYKSLVATSEHVQPRVYMALAFIALEKNDSRNALHFLHLAMQDLVISSNNAVIFLLRAKALKMEGRGEEAQNAIAQYAYYLKGNKRI